PSPRPSRVEPRGSVPVRRHRSESLIRRAHLTDARDELFGLRQKIPDDDGDALGCWMKAIGKIEVPHRRDVLQKKRIEKRAILRGEPWVDRPESVIVVLAPIAGGLHASQQKRDMPVFEIFKNSRERTLGNFWIDAAQRVVGAKLDNGAVDLFIEAP